MSHSPVANDLSTRIEITMDSISAGRKEVAAFCAGTSLVAYAPKHFTGGARRVDDLSWWKPFLQLRGPERIAGPDEASRLFSRTREKPAADNSICIDHSEDDVVLPPLSATSASIFTAMRIRGQVVMPNYHDNRYHEPVPDKMPAAYVIAERVAAPIELRFFPQRSVPRPTIVDC